ncbi:MAG: lysophospholipase [Desulfobulbaceae bacterium]|nr:lysophospholipase [Desulfobulbaceae bacterium]HIJ89745.1 hypothetical protein [Deltaproteobacteria bacterium]
MPRIVIVFCVSVAASYLGICVVLFVFQRSLIYFPQANALRSPATLKLSVAEAEVVASLRPHDGPKALLYFGGNAEDVSLSLPAFSTIFPEHAIYLLHYRGYGGSSGTPSEEAIRKDALALFDAVHAKHPEVLVVGRSVGSGVAVRLASQRPVSRLVLVTPGYSLEELVARLYPYIPVRWLLLDKFESWRYAPRVTAPTVLVAAENDEVISRSSTERLHACFAKGVATLKVIAGATHNTISESPQYLEILKGTP